MSWDPDDLPDVDVDATITEAIQNAIENVGRRAQQELENEAPKLHPDTRCDMDASGEWIRGEWVDLEDHR